MHKITPLLLPELQLLKLPSKSKKLGTNFFFRDLIQSKKTSWQLAQTQKQPATQLCKKASLKIYQTSLCFFLSLRVSLSLSQEKAPNPNTKVPGKFPRLFSFCKFFSLKLLVQCPWQFLTLSQWRSWWTPQASYLEGKKMRQKNIQNKTKTQTQTQTREKKKKKDNLDQLDKAATMLTNWAATQQRTGTMGFENNSRFLRKAIKQSEDERLPPVLSGIAKSYPGSLILCICSELAVGTRESLVCFFITLVLFFSFSSHSDFGKQNPTQKRKKTPGKKNLKPSLKLSGNGWKGMVRHRAFRVRFRVNKMGKTTTKKEKSQKHVENILGWVRY